MPRAPSPRSARRRSRSPCPSRLLSSSRQVVAPWSSAHRPRAGAASRRRRSLDHARAPVAVDDDRRRYLGDRQRPDNPRVLLEVVRRVDEDRRTVAADLLRRPTRGAIVVALGAEEQNDDLAPIERARDLGGHALAADRLPAPAGACSGLCPNGGAATARGGRAGGARR